MEIFVLRRFLYCGDFCTVEIFVLWRFLYCGDFCTWGFLNWDLLGSAIKRIDILFYWSSVDFNANYLFCYCFVYNT